MESEQTRQAAYRVRRLFAERKESLHETLRTGCGPISLFLERPFRSAALQRRAHGMNLWLTRFPGDLSKGEGYHTATCAKFTPAEAEAVVRTILDICDAATGPRHTARIYGQPVNGRHGLRLVVAPVALLLGLAGTSQAESKDIFSEVATATHASFADDGRTRLTRR